MGCGVWGVGCGVWGFEFGVWGLNLRDAGAERGAQRAHLRWGLGVGARGVVLGVEGVPARSVYQKGFAGSVPDYNRFACSG